MSDHSCAEHGHYCSICEEQERLDGIRAEVTAQVKSWVWNCSIFEIYDEIREEEPDRLGLIFEEAFKTFTDESSISQLEELAYHLDVDINRRRDSDG